MALTIAASVWIAPLMTRPVSDVRVSDEEWKELFGAIWAAVDLTKTLQGKAQSGWALLNAVVGSHISLTTSRLPVTNTY